MAVGDYRVDASVIRGGWGVGGPPPEGHPRRCQGKSQRHRGQCGRWALKGSPYCALHGGRYPIRCRMKGLYTKKATGKLRDLLSDLETRDAERLSLAGEVDVARALCDSAVRLFNAALENEAKPETMGRAIELLQGSLTHVSDMVAKMAKVTAISPGMLSAAQMDFVIGEVVTLMKRRLEDDHPDILAKLVEDMDNIRVPEEKHAPVQISIL